MKVKKQWQQPDISVIKERSSQKVIGSSRGGSMRYGTGVGPTPPAPYSTGVGPTPTPAGTGVGPTPDKRYSTGIGPTPEARYSTGIGPTPTPT